MNCAFVFEDRVLVLPMTYLEVNGIPPSGELTVEYNYDRTSTFSSASRHRLGVTIPKLNIEGLYAYLTWKRGHCSSSISLTEALFYLYAHLDHDDIIPLLDLQETVYFEYQCNFVFKPDARFYVNQLKNDLPYFIDLLHDSSLPTSARKRTFYEMREGLGPSTPKERLIQRLTRIKNPDEYYGREHVSEIYSSETDQSE